MPKTPVPGIGWFATCQDTEGNVFGIMESDPRPGKGAMRAGAVR